MAFIKCAVAILVSATISAWSLSSAASTDEQCSPYIYPDVDEADIKIAVILGMHDSYNGSCNSSYNTEALQEAIAVKWIIGLLNGDNKTGSFIPGVRIGMEVYDDCRTEYLASHQAGYLASQVMNAPVSPATCSISSSAKPIAGVIGSSISQTTTIIAKILEPTKVPVVGASATAPELGNKSKYPNFVRVIPSDIEQATVIIQLAKRYSWSYIIGISTSDMYGIEGMQELERLAKQQLICISWFNDFDLYNNTKQFDFARYKLVNPLENTTNNSLGIVYFGLEAPLLNLLEYIKRQRDFWQGFSQKMNQIYWVVSDAVQTSSNLAGLINEYNTNMLVVTPYLISLGSFQKYFFNILKNPPDWIQGQWRVAISSVMRNNFGCISYNFSEESFASCKISNSQFSNYVPAILDAVYLLSNTLKMFHSKACYNQSGACLAFKEGLNKGLRRSYEIQNLNYPAISSSYLPEEFKNSSRFLVKVSGDFEVVGQPLYSIQAIKGNNFAVVHTFQNDILKNISAFDKVPKISECKTTCKDCQNIGEISYLFQPGDIILLGIYSIHWPSEGEAFKCGLYREKSSSYTAMEAFISAIDQMKNVTRQNIGYLILDDCYSTLTLSRILNEVMSGDLVIWNIHNNVTFNASKVAVAIGAQSSHVTLGALTILKDLQIPMISYSATSPDLGKEIIFPFFSRTVNSDILQVRAITDILMKLKVTYVGAIVVNNLYGLEFYKSFRSLAESKKICVTDANMVTELTSAKEFSSFLQDYRLDNIHVIVVIAMDKIAVNLLQAVPLQNEEFVFIGSEAWGPNSNIIAQNTGKSARGSIVMGATSLQPSSGLKERLQTLNPFAKESTIWMREFWQDIFHCDMPGGFNNIHGGRCNPQTSFNSDMLDDMVTSPLVAHSTIATMSAALAINSLLQDKKTMPFDPYELTEAIRSVKFSSAGGEIRPFLEDGNGNFGLNIYNVQQIGDNYVYVNVGSYDNSKGLSLNNSFIFYNNIGQVTSTIESSCDNRFECQQVCTGGSSDPGISIPPTSLTPNKEGSNSSAEATIITLAVLLAVFILITIMFIVMVILMYMGKIYLIKKKPFIAWRNQPDNIMSSRVRFSSLQDTLYTNPHSNSSSDSPPQLPARNNPTYTGAFINEAQSDTDWPTHPVVSDGFPVRERANSLPTQTDQPKTCQVNQASSCMIEDFRSKHKNHHLNPVKKEVPITFPHVMGMTNQGPASDNNPYGGLCRNDQHPVLHSSKYPLEPIVFENVPGAIYTLPMINNPYNFINVINQPNTFVTVNTSQGIIQIPYELFLQQLNPNGHHFQNIHNRPLSNPKVQNEVYYHEQPSSEVIDGPVFSHDRVVNNTLVNDYITPRDVVYGSTGGTEVNSPDSGAEFISKDNLQKLSASPTYSHIKYISPDGGLVSGDSNKHSPAGHHGQHFATDNNNYLMPGQYSSKPSAVKFITPDGWLKNSDMLPSHLQQQQLTNIMKESNLALNDNLQLSDPSANPIFLQNNEALEQQHLQNYISGFDRPNLEPLPINISPTDSNPGTKLPSTQTAEIPTHDKQVADHKHHRTHQNSSRNVLKLCSDILEEQEPEMV